MWQTLVGVFVGVSSLFGGLFATSAPASQPAAVTQAVTAPAASTTPPSLSGQAPSSPSGQATIVEQHITQPVIERTVERIVREPAQEPVTLPILALLFNQLDNKLTGKINNITASNNQGLAPVWQAVAQSQRIDQLTNTTITTPIVVNPTVNGGTLSGVTVSANSITTGTLSAATTTITGDLTVSGTVTGGTLSVSGLSSGGAVSAPYFTATSTTATSSFQALAVAGYATLATTTIAGPLTLSQTASALLSTDSLGQIVATTTLASSYLSLPQGYTLVGGASGTAQATSSLFVANTGNVGIGTTSPWAKFSINNSTADTAGQPLFTIASSTASATTTAFIVTNNGNVGIGTTGPGHKLTVSGSGTSGGFLVTGGDAAAVNVLSNNGYDWQYNTIHSLSAGGLAIQTKWNTGATSLALQPDGGNVGIGTTGPGSLLHLFSSNPVVRMEDSDGGYGTISGNGGHLTFSADVGNAVAGTRMAFEVDGSEKVRIDSQGNVGIGTTTPATKLNVNNSASTVAGVFKGSNTGAVGIGSQNGAGFLQGYTNDSIVATADLILNPTAGNVGIGTTTPGTAFNIYGGSTYRGLTGSLLLENSIPGVQFYDTNDNTGSAITSNAGVLNFYTRNSSGAFAGTDLKMLIDGSGNVGIGTTGPSGKLEVANGNAHVSNSSTNPASSGAVKGLSFGFDANLEHGWIQAVRNNGSEKRDLELQPIGGNVGIGTTTPNNKLDVNGILGVVNGTGRYVTLAQSGTEARFVTNDKYWFDTDGIVRASINDGGLSVGSTYYTTDAPSSGAIIQGNVGIGTTNPAHRLTVASPAGNLPAIYLQRGGAQRYGLYLDGNDYLNLARYNSSDVFQANVMTVDTSGNVGIGTTNPANALTVNGNVNIGPSIGGTLDIQAADAIAIIKSSTGTNRARLRFNNTGGTTELGMDSSTGFGFFGTAVTPYSFVVRNQSNTPILFGHTSPELTILDGGNVGIGTTTPDSNLSVSGGNTQLHVSGGGTSYVQIDGGSVSQAAGVSFGYRGGSNQFGIGYNGSAANTLGFFTGANLSSGGTPSMVMNSSGNVGIGTTAPGDKLDVRDGNIAGSHILQSGDVNTSLAYFNGVGSTQAGSSFGGMRVLTDGTTWYKGNLAFYTAGVDGTDPTKIPAERMRVDASGNVGIGTTSPATKLDVYGNINIKSASALTFGLETGENTYIQGSAASHYVRIVNNNSEALRIIDGGNVGIGTTSPALKLQVNGNIGPNTDNTYTDGTATYRWSAVYAANGTIQTSDARLKSNVTDLNYGLADLMKLHPVSFTWTSNPEQGTKLGFIAQEVQPVMPEVVNTGDDANHTLGITYTEFIPTIVKAIQELNGKIGTLADTVAGFADHFVTKELSFDRAAGDTMTLKTLCLSDANGTSCYTRSQLDSFVQSQGAAQTAAAASTQGANATPATLTLNGNATSTIALGASYNDLGATFTHSGITETIYATSTVDTSVAGTTTLDYWATWYPDPAATTSAETLHTVREVVVTDPNAEQGNATNTTQTATSTGQ